MARKKAEHSHILNTRVETYSSHVVDKLVGIKGRDRSDVATFIIRSWIAAQGGTVRRDRSMAVYSAEAMSAYRLVQETSLPGADPQDPAALVGRLKQMADGLRALADEKPTDLRLASLQQFF